jgi:hypothetical protein
MEAHCVLCDIRNENINCRLILVLKGLIYVNVRCTLAIVERNITTQSSHYVPRVIE